MGRPRKNDEETQEQVEETPAEEPVAEAAPPAEEPVPAAEAAPGPIVEEEAAARAPVPPEEPPAEVEAPAETPAETETPAAEAAPPGEAAPAKTRKRLPRAQRRQRSKPQRERPAARRPIVRLPKPEHPRGRRKERRGVVVSDAMDKTIVVRVDTVKPHPVYKKIVRRSAKLHAHDEANAAKKGDVVRLVETRPLSKTKAWRLAEVLEEAK